MKHELNRDQLENLGAYIYSNISESDSDMDLHEYKEKVIADIVSIIAGVDSSWLVNLEYEKLCRLRGKFNDYERGVLNGIDNYDSELDDSELEDNNPYSPDSFIPVTFYNPDSDKETVFIVFANDSKTIKKLKRVFTENKINIREQWTTDYYDNESTFFKTGLSKARAKKLCDNGIFNW